jgi:hypothetical protein
VACPASHTVEDPGCTLTCEPHQRRHHPSELFDARKFDAWVCILFRAGRWSCLGLLALNGANLVSLESVRVLVATGAIA